MQRKINPKITSIILYTLPDVFSKAIGLILLPLILSYLSVSEFGQLELLFLVGTVLQFVFHFGWSSAHIRFYQEAEVNSDNLNITLLLFRLFVQAIILFLLWLTGIEAVTKLIVDNTDLTTAFLGVIGLFVVREHLLFYENKFRLQEKAKHFAIVNTSYGALQLVCVYLLLVPLELGLTGVIWGQLIATIIVLCFLLVLDHKWLFKGKFSFSLFKRCLNFGLPLIPSAIALLVITASDRYMLKWLIEPNEDSLVTVGIYSFGLKIVALMTLITKGFQLFWAPYVYKTYREVDAVHKFSYVFRVYSFLLTLLAFMVLFLSPLIFLLFPDYEEVRSILPALLCGCLVYSIGDYFCIGIDIKEKSTIRAKIGMGTAILNILLNMSLIPYFGAPGAAMATLISYTLFSLLQLRASNKLYPVPYPYGIWVLGIIWIFLATPLLFQSPVYLWGYATLGLITLYVLFRVKGGFSHQPNLKSNRS